MPIDSQNELPHLRFPVGEQEGEVSLSGLYDTGAALNTGLLSYHKHIMMKKPNIVAEYMEATHLTPSNYAAPLQVQINTTNPSTAY